MRPAVTPYGDRPTVLRRCVDQVEKGLREWCGTELLCDDEEGQWAASRIREMPPLQGTECLNLTRADRLLIPSPFGSSRVPLDRRSVTGFICIDRQPNGVQDTTSGVRSMM